MRSTALGWETNMTRQEFIQALFAASGALVLARSARGRLRSFQERRVSGLTIRQIRNATLVVDYAAKRFLINPTLARREGQALPELTEVS